MDLKLTKGFNIIISIFLFVTAIAITPYGKSAYTFAINELKNSITPQVSADTQQLEKQHRFEKLSIFHVQQKLEEQQKLDEQLKFEEQLKLEVQRKLQVQEKLAAQKLAEKLKQEKLALAAKQQVSLSKSQTSISKEIKKVAILPTTEPTLLIDKIQGKGNARQAIVVTTNSFGSVNATIKTFEKINDTWRQVDSFAGTVGIKGFIYNKVEGDGRSPIGIFSLGTAFGRYSNPGTVLNYRRSTTNDFWVDDSDSPLYNTWQEGPANGRWSSAEKMYIPQYNYGFVINYNTAKRIPGKGSAIFFHVWSGAGSGTAGCIAASQNNVISTLKWLNPSKNPVIIEGPMSEVIKM